MAYTVLHYMNQFFAGEGGEDMADFTPEVRTGPVGPGIALDELFSGEAKIAATLVCGDNFFATRQEESLSLLVRSMNKYCPNLVIAGPSFYAGRYGFACGHVMKEAGKRGIPCVAGMSDESPAIEMFRECGFIMRTGASAAGMKKALADMARMALKILRDERLGSADDEGYFHRNKRRNFFQEHNAGVRAVDMLVAKMAGEPFTSEYIQRIPARVQPASPLAKLSSATVALLNTGGMVPAGNPDRIEGSAATKFGVYSMEGLEALEAGRVISVHGGYNTTFSDDNPNRIVPLDVLRELEKEGYIGKVHESFYSTVGTGASLTNGEAFGKAIAGMLNEAGVDAAIMVST